MRNLTNFSSSDSSDEASLMAVMLNSVGAGGAACPVPAASSEDAGRGSGALGDEP